MRELFEEPRRYRRGEEFSSKPVLNNGYIKLTTRPEKIGASDLLIDEVVKLGIRWYPITVANPPPTGQAVHI